ncbi:hypothetical protein B0H14DRAFT_2768505, partial [Mycena olivaceomarginata]
MSAMVLAPCINNGLLFIMCSGICPTACAKCRCNKDHRHSGKFGSTLYNSSIGFASGFSASVSPASMSPPAGAHDQCL